MEERNFREMLEAQWAQGNFVCVGLDSEYAKIPDIVRASKVNTAEAIFAFNRAIVDATRDLVCAYKPNIAFYEAHGEAGWRALHKTSIYIRNAAPGVPIILDAKRADIGNTNRGYVQAFDLLQADAITVHPYLGQEALKPFLDRKEKGVIVLCRTSNDGAGEFQDLPVLFSEDTKRDIKRYFGDSMPWSFSKLYQYVAYRVAVHWNKNNNCGVVVGATYPQELRHVRKIVRDMPILIPAVGAQGGDVEDTVWAGRDSRGWGMIINSSRNIIFASKGDDFAEAARRETIKLRDTINFYRDAAN